MEELGKFKIPVSKEAFEHGLALGVKVYQDKMSFKDKFFLGGSSELQADIYGFIAESAVCEFFKQDFPSFIPNQVDLFDLEINGKRIDVKKVGYTARGGQPKITIKKKQYDKKKESIDAFMFVTFEGAFEQKLVGEQQHRIFVPMHGHSSIWILGWIDTPKVEQVGRSYFWTNRDGTKQDESWCLVLKDLKPVSELVK